MARLQIALDILGEEGRHLAEVTVRPDWGPALEWVRFEGIREGRLPAVTGAGAGTVEPIWDGRAGRPYVSGFRAVIHAEGGEVVRGIPTSYLQELAKRAAAALVEKGLLQSGEVVRYAVRALAAPAEAAAEDPDGGFSVEDVAEPLPIDEVPLAGFMDRAVVANPGREAARMPVFLPQHVLDEVVAQSREAGGVETGGVLVGRLHRDGGAAPVIFVEITAQIPASHTEPRPTKLTFTGGTWAAVRAAIALRRRGELMLGWWHFHPDFCRLRTCAPERRRSCPVARGFLSAEDVHLHATCFPSAYQVALLVSEIAVAGGMTWSLFGWSQGGLASRGFHVLGEEARGAAATPPPRRRRTEAPRTTDRHTHGGGTHATRAPAGG